jgi:hypothetical protein
VAQSLQLGCRISLRSLVGRASLPASMGHRTRRVTYMNKRAECFFMRVERLDSDQILCHLPGPDPTGRNALRLSVLELLDRLENAIRCSGC